MATVKSDRTSRSPFRNVYIYLALLIPAAVLGFAPSYFSGVTISRKPVTGLIHVHTALMMLWLVMLIAQAWFIHTKRFQLHRWVGRSSYVIAPVIIVMTLVMTHDNLNRAPDGIALMDARIEAFTWGQIIGFGLAWGLAILYRKKTPLHVRFIVSTAFAIGSAIVLRILLNWFGWVPGLDSFESQVAANWTVLTLPLLGLIALDWRMGLKRSPFWMITIVIAIMHIGFFTFTRTDGWMAFVRWFADLTL